MKTLALALLLVSSGAWAQEYTLTSYGPPAVPPGVGSSWLIVSVAFGAPASGHVYMDSVTGMPEGMTWTPWCGENGGTYNLGWATCSREANGLRRWYVGVFSAAQWRNAVFELSTPAGTPPGTYAVVFTFTINAVQHSITVPVTVAAPVVPTKSPGLSPILNVPRLSEVISNFTAVAGPGGWCKSVEPPDFVYTNAGENVSGYRSLWYYDGGHSYFAMGDYLGDQATWDQCGFWVIDHYVARSESMTTGYVLPLGNEVGMFRGLYMAWQRTSDPTQKARYAAALYKLTTQTPYATSGLAQIGDSYGPGGLMISPTAPGPRDPNLRETALLGGVYLYNIRVGNFTSSGEAARRVRRNAEWVMLYFDLAYVKHIYEYYEQPFYIGVALQFLIDYYDYSADPRVPSIVKAAIDWQWEHGVDPVSHRVAYGSFLPEQKTTNSPAGRESALCDITAGCAGYPGMTTFNGATVTGATTGASATITLSGHTVLASERWATLVVKSGTNFTPGDYQIVSVNTGANTVTVDRDASTGDGSALVGYLRPAVTIIDGTRVTVAAAGAGSTLTVTGYVPVSGDVGRWVYLESGNGVTPGRYRINSVNTGTGVWALDRAVSTGATSTVTGLLVTPFFDDIAAPMMLPAYYMWWWQMTGDQSYRQKGFQLWNAAVLATDKGKDMNQQMYNAYDFFRWAAPRVRTGSAEVLGRVVR
jgi:hypothetical protein